MKKIIILLSVILGLLGSSAYSLTVFDNCMVKDNLHGAISKPYYISLILTTGAEIIDSNGYKAKDIPKFISREFDYAIIPYGIKHNEMAVIKLDDINVKDELSGFLVNTDKNNIHYIIKLGDRLADVNL